LHPAAAVVVTVVHSSDEATAETRVSATTLAAQYIERNRYQVHHRCHVVNADCHNAVIHELTIMAEAVAAAVLAQIINLMRLQQQ
jgi:hypothetical protein